jgi:D-amino-acid dehydrogenase
VNARALVDYQRSLGCEQDALERDACLALEPALGSDGTGLGARLAGGIYTASEEVGDCYRFCVGLERHLMAMPHVRFALGTQVRRLAVEKRRVVGVDTSSGPVDADAFVVAAGPVSGRLVKPIGVRIPVYPLKGYSLTLPVRGPAPHVSVTDAKAQGRLRTARRRRRPDAARRGHGGHRRLVSLPDPVRLRQLVAEARAGVSPRRRLRRAARRDGARGAACGRRRRSAARSSARRPIANLFLNVGHGALGWTLALASGRDRRRRRSRDARPEIPLDGFGTAARVRRR